MTWDNESIGALSDFGANRLYVDVEFDEPFYWKVTVDLTGVAPMRKFNCVYDIIDQVFEGDEVLVDWAADFDDDNVLYELFVSLLFDNLTPERRAVAAAFAEMTGDKVILHGSCKESHINWLDHIAYQYKATAKAECICGA